MFWNEFKPKSSFQNVEGNFFGFLEFIFHFPKIMNESGKQTNGIFCFSQKDRCVFKVFHFLN